MSLADSLSRGDQALKQTLDKFAPPGEAQE